MTPEKYLWYSYRNASNIKIGITPMNDGNVKQQIVDKIKNNSSILVTVSDSPSVDELSAALGLTILLNKMKKHATAVFSGAIPPAITFLDPAKTFENTVDSLRDFIIALDKEKADHLRYKVEGDVVRIFITPYRTTITSNDLDFSQGDYNVELVFALGVQNKDHLDKALEAHGRILHDAAVVTIGAGGSKSDLGSIDWTDQNASSLCEMIVSLTDSLKSDKPLFDEQIATALLTGIVASTDRFSNNKTSSKVMTLAAELMAAGANQQLIASKLQEAHAIDIAPVQTAAPIAPVVETQPEVADASDEGDGSLAVSHEPQGTLDEVTRQTAEAEQEEAAKRAEEVLAQQLESVSNVAVEPSLISVADLEKDLAAANVAIDAPVVVEPAPAAPQEITPPQQPEPTVQPASEEISLQIPSHDSASASDRTGTPQLRGAVSEEVWKKIDSEPTMGGTLNATAEQAAEDSRREVEEDRNRTILTHDAEPISSGATPSFQSAFNSPSQDATSASQPAADQIQAEEVTEITSHARAMQPPSMSVETPADDTSHDEARAAVHAAFEAAPPAAAPTFPPLPDFSTLPPLPPVPPMPNGMTMPAPTPTPAPQAAPADPGQFKIPGQS